MPPSDLADPILATQARARFAFQPYVDVVLQQVIGHEALLRGPLGEAADCVLGAVPEPDRNAFDRLLRLQAMQKAVDLGIVSHGHQLSLNVLSTAIGRHAEGLVNTLEAAQSLGIPSDRLVLEITEIEKVADPASLRAVLQELRSSGFRTAIDDMGRGWSNLTLLVQLQPDIVKLDRAFIEDIHSEKARHTVVRHMKGACDDLGCAIIAEGVEKPAESAALRELGIHLQQGFLFSRPLLCQLNLQPAFPQYS